MAFEATPVNLFFFMYSLPKIANDNYILDAWKGTQ